MKSVISLVKKYKLLVVITLIAFCIRVIKLGSTPFNFHEDEVLVGYVGRYILENGFDIFGNKWPLLYFNKFGDYYIIGPMYLSAVSTFIFGVNEFAVRFPAAVMGSLVTIPVFILTFFTTKNKKIALIASFFVAILPWHIVLSRSSVEGVIGSTIFLASIVFIFWGIQKNEYKYIVYSSIGLFLTYWIYHPFRLYAPVAFIPVLFLYPSIRKNKKLFLSILISIVFFFSLTIYISTTDWGSGRLKQTSIFSDLSGVDIQVTQQLYNSGENNIFVARLFNNKAIGYGREYINQYVSYFSPNYLFLKGGAESRYDMPNQGLLYITFLVLICASLLPIGKKLQYDSKLLIYLGFLLLLSPIPAAFTYYGSPNIHRTVLLGILLVIPSAIGFYKLQQLHKFIPVVVLLVLFAEVLYFHHQYTVQADVYNAKRRNNGFKQVVEYVSQNRNKYDKVYVPGEGSMGLYYVFFTKDFNPTYANLFQSDARIESVGNVKFETEPCITELVSMDSKPESLFINRPECADASDTFEKIDEIVGADPVSKFKVYKVKK